MKKHKFSRALIYVLFSILLFVSAVLPCFAIEFDVGGGSGIGTRADPVFLPSVRFNVHPTYYQNQLDSDHYFSFPFDPLFTNFVSSEHFCENYGDLADIITDLDSSDSSSCNFSYNYYSYSGSYSYMNGGTLECYYSLTSECSDQITAVSFYVDQFFAWSQPVNDFNSELSIDIYLDQSDLDPSSYEDWMYISFEYMPLGSYYPDASYTPVSLPVSDFIDVSNDRLTISLDSFFNDLDSTYVIYDVRDFQFYIPVDFQETVFINGSLTYYVNPDVSIVSKLYPTRSEQMELYDYTAWITNAIEGFLFLEIFPGFYLSGFLMAILGFVMFIWALKVFAGG